MAWDWVAIAAVASAIAAGGGTGYYIYASEQARSDAQKNMKKQSTNQALQQMVAQQKAANTQLQSQNTGLRVALAEASVQPAPDNTPLIIAGAALAFLLLRKKLL
jgi:hypothetical protein